MPRPTLTQKMSNAAFEKVSHRATWSREFGSFAKSFPALIHTTGLCQAVAFAQSRDHGKELLSDVVAVMATAESTIGNVDAFSQRVRQDSTVHYMRLSRLALDAATWVKRYVEALEPKGPVAATAALAEEGTGASRTSL